MARGINLGHKERDKFTIPAFVARNAIEFVDNFISYRAVRTRHPYRPAAYRETYSS